MASSRVYVGGLPSRTTESDLERFFRGYGRIQIFIKNGYGFVELNDDRDADDAICELNGRTLLGKRVTVERARGLPRGGNRRFNGSRCHVNSRFRRAPIRTKFRVTVENLSSRISWQDLKDYMRQAGEVSYADAHKHHRNEGVIDFASYSDMRNAIMKFDGTELNGRRIRLVESMSRRSLSYSNNSSSAIRSSRSRSRTPSAKRSSRSRSHTPAMRSSRSRARTPSAMRSSRSRSRTRSALRSSNSRSQTRSAISFSNSRSRTRSAVRSMSEISASPSSGSISIPSFRSSSSMGRSTISKKRCVERSRSRSHSENPCKRFKCREESKDRSRSATKSSESRSRYH